MADVNLLFTYIWSVTQLNQGEAWTPICIPGCSEEFMLHVYTCFKGDNMGMVMVCTDHDSDYFLECNEFRVSVFDYLFQNRFYKGIKELSIFEMVDRQTISGFEIVDRKAIVCGLISENKLQQYTTVNFPMVSKTNHRMQS